MGHYGPELSQPMEEGTTHVSLIAPNGDAVAITNTINEWYVSVLIILMAPPLR